MKSSGMPAWMKTTLLWGLIFLLVYGLMALEARQKEGRGSVRATTYSVDPRGYKALYLWFESMDIPIKRWSKPLRELPQEASSVLIVEPEVGPDRGEMKSLDLWIKGGGTLILVMRSQNIFLQRFGLHAETRGDVYEEKEVLSQPGPYTAGVRTILSKNHPNLYPDQPEWIFHLRDNKGGLLAVMNHGLGRVIVLSDIILLSNGTLRKGDHAKLALNLLLTHRGEGALLVDEYHHGYGRATSVLGYLARSRAFVPFLQGLLLLLILWAAFGRRFGPSRSRGEEEGQTSLAYFKAIGQLFQRAGARNLALETSVRWAQEESRKYLIDRDAGFQKKLQTIKADLKNREMTDQELLVRVKGLHEALDSARRKMPGKGGAVDSAGD